MVFPNLLKSNDMRDIFSISDEFRTIMYATLILTGILLAGVYYHVGTLTMLSQVTVGSVALLSFAAVFFPKNGMKTFLAILYFGLVFTLGHTVFYTLNKIVPEIKEAKRVDSIMKRSQSSVDLTIPARSIWKSGLYDKTYFRITEVDGKYVHGERWIFSMQGGYWAEEETIMMKDRFKAFYHLTNDIPVIRVGPGQLWKRTHGSVMHPEVLKVKACFPEHECFEAELHSGKPTSPYINYSDEFISFDKLLREFELIAEPMTNED
jgi:hypothetical protein